jgi:hypothetical protein
MVTTTYVTWTPTTHADYDHLKGRAVFSADGEKLGSIDAIFHPEAPMPEARGGHVFLVKPGMLKSWFGGGEEFYVPETAISDVAEDAVTLSYAKERLEAQGWGAKPAGINRFKRA